MLTGLNHLGATTKSVYACSVRALLQSCVPIASSGEAAASFKTGTSLEDKYVGVWRQVADLPVTHSTCESFHGRLLAIGGEMDSGEPSTAVYMYDSTTNSWEIISHMTTSWRDCFTASVLPDNQLMVVGGMTGRYGSAITDTVEVANTIDV